MSGRAATQTKIVGRYALSVGLTEMPSPDNWLWIPLPDVARLESGHTPSRKHPEYWDGAIDWIGIKDARENHGSIISDTLQKVTQLGLDNSASRLLPKGTVCLSRTASVGYTTIMGKDMATSQDFVNWVCTEAIDPQFLMRLFIAEKESLLEFGKGTTHKTIYFPEVKALHVCLPPKNEQTRIVTAIESLQQRSNRARTLLSDIRPKLDILRQSILQAAFSGRLTADWRSKNPDVEPADKLLAHIRTERRQRWETDQLEKFKAKGRKPPKNWQDRYEKTKGSIVRATIADLNADGVAIEYVPKSWELVRLGDVIDLQAGYAFKSSWFTQNGVRLLRGTNIEPGSTRWKDTVYLPDDRAQEFQDYLLEDGDIVIAMDRPIISGGLKVSRISDTDLPALLLQRVGRFCIPQHISIDYIYQYVLSNFFLSHIGATATGTQLPHISSNDIESAILPLPPIEEQNIIVREVNSVFESCVRATAAIRNAQEGLEKLDQSILSKAFRGELVPQDPSDEPASVLLSRIRASSEAEKPKRKRAARKKKTS